MTALARLSFRVLPERSEGFESAYRQKIKPLLERHGLEEAEGRGHPTVEGVFSQLFAVETPSIIAARKQALRKDPAWQQVLRDLGAVFGSTDPDGFVRWHLGIYRTPAGPGRIVEAGSGFRRGLWQIIGVHDGLPSANIYDILQDRTGYLWFATGGGGVCRYDGKEFLIFTTEDGLADNDVWSILEDGAGRLWFGTEAGGVSRYDGEEFTTFTTDDGLAGNTVASLLEDGAGHLWFGTRDGVSRYDGAAFVTFTIEDGVAFVNSMAEDRAGHLWFGTNNGVSRYDGKGFATLFLEQRVAHEIVHSLLVDRDGFLWVGTMGGGVSRYDGVQYTTFTTEDGLAHNGVLHLREDRQGTLWCTTWGGGVPFRRKPVHLFRGRRFYQILGRG